MVFAAVGLLFRRLSAQQLELHALLAHTMMVRREKSEVLTQLPPKRRQRVDASLVVEEASLVLLPAAQRLRWAWQPVESRLGGGWLLLRVHWREELAHRA